MESLLQPDSPLSDAGRAEASAQRYRPEGNLPAPRRQRSPARNDVRNASRQRSRSRDTEFRAHGVRPGVQQVLDEASRNLSENTAVIGASEEVLRGRLENWRTPLATALEASMAVANVEAVQNQAFVAGTRPQGKKNKKNKAVVWLATEAHVQVQSLASPWAELTALGMLQVLPMRGSVEEAAGLRKLTPSTGRWIFLTAHTGWCNPEKVAVTEPHGFPVPTPDYDNAVVAFGSRFGSFSKVAQPYDAYFPWSQANMDLYTNSNTKPNWITNAESGRIPPHLSQAELRQQPVYGAIRVLSRNIYHTDEPEYQALIQNREVVLRDVKTFYDCPEHDVQAGVGHIVLVPDMHVVLPQATTMPPLKEWQTTLRPVIVKTDTRTAQLHRLYTFHRINEAELAARTTPNSEEGAAEKADTFRTARAGIAQQLLAGGDQRVTTEPGRTIAKMLWLLPAVYSPWRFVELPPELMPAARTMQETRAHGTGIVSSVIPQNITYDLIQVIKQDANRDAARTGLREGEYTETLHTRALSGCVGAVRYGDRVDRRGEQPVLQHGTYPQGWDEPPMQRMLGAVHLLCGNTMDWTPNAAVAYLIKKDANTNILQDHHAEELGPCYHLVLSRGPVEIVYADGLICTANDVSIVGESESRMLYNGDMMSVPTSMRRNKVYTIVATNEAAVVITLRYTLDVR